MSLRSIDLNLLVILDALLQESSVTRAAAKIPLSQPAASLALQRLRNLLGDPLLVRSGAGMVLTPAAERLREPIARILREIGETFEPESFNPVTADNVFRITATDHAKLTLLPGLLKRFSELAPSIQLICLSVDALPIRNEHVQKGEIDLTLAYLPEPPEGFHCKTLLRERFVCVARKGHPQLLNGMTLKVFLQVRHILVSPLGGSLRGQVDEALQRMGERRFIALSVPHFSLIPSIISGSDLIATVPSRIAHRPEWSAILEVFEVPVPVVGFELMMAWHPRHHHSAAHQWLRGQVEGVAFTED